MRHFLILFFLILFRPIAAQTDEFAGIYILKEEADNGIIQHKMVLHEEGTFLFSSFFSPNEIEGKMLEIKSMYGSGKWNNNGNQISFVVNKEEDFDEDRILDFSNTLARIQESAPGSTNGESGSMELFFFESNISWVKELKLNRQ